MSTQLTFFLGHTEFRQPFRLGLQQLQASEMALQHVQLSPPSVPHGAQSQLQLPRCLRNWYKPNSARTTTTQQASTIHTIPATGRAISVPFLQHCPLPLGNRM